MDSNHYLDMQGALRDYLAKVVEPNIMLTFNFNGVWNRPRMSMRAIFSERQTSIESAHRKISKFFCVMQRKEFGRDWNGQYDRPWPLAFGFVEHPTTNLHFHVIANLCPHFLSGIVSQGREVWEMIQPGGQLDVQPTVGDPTAQIIYATKALLSAEAWDGRFTYDDSRKNIPSQSLQAQLLELRANVADAVASAKIEAALAQAKRVRLLEEAHTEKMSPPSLTNG
jgi:hypothetical protein